MNLYVILVFWVILCNSRIFPESTPLYTKPILAFFPILVVLLLKRRKIEKYRSLIFLPFFIFFYARFNSMTGVYTRTIGFVTISVFAVYLLDRFSTCRREAKLIFYFFIAQLILTLFEYLVSKNFLYEQLQVGGRFRPTAFFAHPLNNGIIVSFFVLLCPFSKLKAKWKYIFIISGLICLFCYNTRSSIIMTIVSLVLCLMLGISRFANFLNKHPSTIILYMVTGFLLFFILSSTSLGGKMFDNEYRSFEDRSSEVRVDNLEMAVNLARNDLLFGVSNFSLDPDDNNGFWIESANLSYLFQYGLVGTIPILFIFFSVLYRFMREIPSKIRWIIILNLLIIGQGAPSYIHGYVYIAFFMVYIALFRVKLPYFFKK